MALTDNNVSYITLDSGDFSDKTGNSNNITNNGTANTTGVINDGRSFDGVNDYLQWVDFDFDNDFSINAWYYLDSGFGGDNPMIFRQDGTHTVQVFGNGTSSRKIRWAVAGASSSFDRTTATDVEEDGWHMITMTRSGNVFKLYKDGVQIDTETVSVGTLNPTNASRLGSTSSGGAWWKGRIDESSFWERELSSSEVTELYNSGAGLQYPYAVSVEVINALFFGGGF